MSVEKLVGAKKVVKRIITDADLVSRIKSDYQEFKKSKLSLDNYFGKKLIYVTTFKGSYRVKDKELSHDNIFVWIPNRKESYTPTDSVKYRIPIAKLSSANPIKMRESDILKLHGINQTFHDIHDIEYSHNLAIDFYSTDGQTHWRSSDLPGFKAGNVDFRIKIAKDSNGATFWIPPMTPSPKQFQCFKFPGKCRFEAADKTHLDIHMKKCIAETQLVTDKVLKDFVSHIYFILRKYTEIKNHKLKK